MKNQWPYTKLLLLQFSCCLLTSIKCQSTDSTPPACPLHLSIAIPEESALLLANGSLVHGDRSFPAGSHYYDGNITRGCICHISSSPCLRKCCAADELVSSDLSKYDKCVKEPSSRGNLSLELAMVAPEMRTKLDSHLNLHDWFSVFESPECEEDYVLLELNPEWYPEDQYLLHSNGSLWIASQGLLPIGRFCMDAKMDSDGLAVLACLKTEEAEEETPTAVRIGYLLSVPFLAVTFLVYAIIPDLRNIYGKTLMCYVVSLLTAYSSISASNFFHFGTGCHVTAKENSAKCSKNEVYSQCGSACPMICDDISNDSHSDRACTSQCIEGCVCKEGYVLENAKGKCIRVQECPRVKH